MREQERLSAACRVGDVSLFVHGVVHSALQSRWNTARRIRRSPTPLRSRGPAGLERCHRGPGGDQLSSEVGSVDEVLRAGALQRLRRIRREGLDRCNDLCASGRGRGYDIPAGPLGSVRAISGRHRSRDRPARTASWCRHLQPRARRWPGWLRRTVSESLLTLWLWRGGEPSPR